MKNGQLYLGIDKLYIENCKSYMANLNTNLG